MLQNYIYELQEGAKKQLKQKDFEIQRMAAEMNNPLQKCDKVMKLSRG